MECDKCGREIPAGDVFCTSCGNPTGQEPSSAEETERAEGPAGQAREAAAEGGAKTPPGEVGGDARETAAAAVPQPPPSTARPGASAPGARTSGWATASLVLGILGWTCLPFLGSVLAVIFAVVAKSEIKKSEGRLKGGGMATAGLVLGAILIGISVIAAGVFFPIFLVSVGPTRTVTKTVQQGAATSVRAEIDMRSGSLEVNGGASELMNGTFVYNMKGWRPEVEYSESSGRLEVRQGGDWSWLFWRARNDWDISFKEGVPLELSAKLNAGSSHMDLGSLNLTGFNADSNAGNITADLSGNMPLLDNVTAKTNAGNVTIDLNGTYAKPCSLNVNSDAGEVKVSLRGEWKADLTGTIDTSAGEVIVNLPDNVGVSVRASTSFGEVDVMGLEKGPGNDTYVNEAYGKSKVTIRLNVKTSAGEVKLVAL